MSEVKCGSSVKSSRGLPECSRTELWVLPMAPSTVLQPRGQCSVYSTFKSICTPGPLHMLLPPPGISSLCLANFFHSWNVPTSQRPFFKQSPCFPSLLTSIAFLFVCLLTFSLFSLSNKTQQDGWDTCSMLLSDPFWHFGMCSVIR